MAGTAVQAPTAVPSVLPSDAPDASPLTYQWSIPISKWSPLCHPRASEVSDQVNAWFLEHWPFPNVKAEVKFLKAGFSLVTSMYFPLAKDDRLHHACKLLTILFLVDDLLEDMSLSTGESYNARLIAIALKKVKYDPSLPVERMWYSIWEDMAAHDMELAEGVKEPTFEFMKAQTDRTRMDITQLGQYLQYREKDVGQALLAALMRFSMNLHVTPEELASVKHIEQNCSCHISVVNDIYSYGKELRKSIESPEEGAVLCSAVKVVADETRMGISAAKRVLWSMTREWELVHDELYKVRVSDPQGCSQALQAYLKGLEYQMSGNELWSKTTPRYSEV
ncbi:aristolochene synthase [Paraphaeosphaeria sporulosa]